MHPFMYSVRLYCPYVHVLGKALLSLRSCTRLGFIVPTFMYSVRDYSPPPPPQKKKKKKKKEEEEEEEEKRKKEEKGA